MTKLTENTLKKIDNDLKVLKVRKKLILDTSESKNSRKKRTRRLIQKGALAEKYFDIKDLSVDQTEKLFRIFSSYIKANKPDKFKQKK